MIYDGEQNPNLRKFNAANLVIGNTYGFKVLAFNFNGAGSLSTEAIFKSCTPPSG